MAEPGNLFDALPRRSAFEAVATFAIVVALLYLGGGLLVPIVLSILLAFALTPLVNFLSRRLRLPDALAVIVAVLLAAFMLGALVYLVGTQVIQLAEEFAGYQDTINAKLRGLQQQIVGADLIENVLAAIEALTAQVTAAFSNGSAVAPMPVTIANDFSGPMSLIGGVVGSLLGPLATLFIVIVFLVFILMGRTDIQERFLRLASRGNYGTTTMALRDAGSRLSRYLLIQLGVNVSYGAIFGIGLMLIGIPGALLWGMLIAVFRYIPFVGAVIIAIIPFMLAFAIDPGWGMLIATVVFFLILDQVTANVVEPRLYGSSTGVSGIAILLSAMFWAALWGPVGLILSTPMTVCLVVLGRYMPFFKVFETLLGSEPVLSPTERLYQRLLSGDTEEAIGITDEAVETDGKDALYDRMMLPVLRLAAQDMSNTPEALAQRRKLATSIEAIIEEYGSVPAIENSPVLLVGAQSEIDEAAAQIIGQRLSGAGIESNVVPAMAVRQEAIGRIDLEGVRLVVLVYLGWNIRAHARYVSSRLRRMQPDLTVFACQLSESRSETASLLHVDRTTHTFTEIVQEIENYLGQAPQPSPAGQVRRILESEALGKALEEIAERMAVPLATINLLDDERHQDEVDAYRLTREIVTTGKPLVIETASAGELADNPYLLENGIQFYAGVPLALEEEEIVGSLIIVDYQDHPFDEAGVERLRGEAAELVRHFGAAQRQLIAAKRSSNA